LREPFRERPLDLELPEPVAIVASPSTAEHRPSTPLSKTAC